MVHVEEELVTQMCDCTRVDYLKDSLAQIACRREAHAQKGVTQTYGSKRDLIIKKVCVTAQAFLFA